MPILTEITTTTEVSELEETLDILKRLLDKLYPSHLSHKPPDDQLVKTVTKQTVLKTLFGDELVPEESGSSRLKELLRKYHPDKFAEDDPLYKELYECTQILTQIKDVYNDLSTGPAVDLSTPTAAASASRAQQAQAASAAASRTGRRGGRRGASRSREAEADELISRVHNTRDESSGTTLYKTGLHLAAERKAPGANQDFINLVEAASAGIIEQTIGKVDRESYLGRDIREGFTPLSSAIQFRSAEAVQALLDKASPEAINQALQVAYGSMEKGFVTPLHLAARHREPECFKRILQVASDENIALAFSISKKENLLLNVAYRQDDATFRDFIKRLPAETLGKALDQSDWLSTFTRTPEMRSKLPILLEKIYNTSTTPHLFVRDQLLVQDQLQEAVPDEFINFVADCFMDEGKWTLKKDRRTGEERGGSSFNDMLSGGMNSGYHERISSTTLARVLKEVSDRVAQAAEETTIPKRLYEFMSEASHTLLHEKLLTVTVDNPVLDLRGTGILSHIKAQYNLHKIYYDDTVDQFIGLQLPIIDEMFSNPKLRVLKIETDLEPDKLKSSVAGARKESKIERLEINGKVHLPQIERRLKAYIARVKGGAAEGETPDFQKGFSISKARKGHGREVNYELAKQLLEDLRNPAQNAEDVFKSSHVDAQRQAIRDIKVTGPKSPFSGLRVTSSDLRGIIDDARSLSKAAATEAKAEQAAAEDTAGRGFTR